MARGFKSGGRKPGSVNVKTRERQQIAERLIAGVPVAALGDIVPGRLLAREVLEFWVAEFHSLAVNHKDADRRERYAALAIETARHLAPYQSPTYRAVMLAPAPPSQQQHARFTLRVFDAVNIDHVNNNHLNGGSTIEDDELCNGKRMN